MTDNGVSIRDFFERLLNDHAAAHREHQAAHDREHQASQKAIDTAATLAKENKADANEWRDAMSDRERAFARVESFETLRERVVNLEKVNAQMIGALNVARFIGFGGLLTGASALIWAITRGGGP